MADFWGWLLTHAARELMLFAAVGFLIGGLDELAVDLLWLARWVRRLRWHRHRVDVDTLPPAERPGRIAVLVPAWDESAVIGEMLRTAIARFGSGDWLIYVATYPNDPATVSAVAAVAAIEPRVRPVPCARPGPTTKADALNHAWAALVADEVREGRSVKAIVLHDAEDVVHAAEPRIFDRLIERFDLVQLPVLPLLDPTSRWIAGHYADAFAEAHGKTLSVREAIGAAVPSAGVGCALSRRAVARIAAEEGGAPFDPQSLTEDYVLGLRVQAAGGRTCFVRLPGAGMKGVVAVREHFPGTFAAAVRQKARWMTGIALDGWERLGWAGSWAERWMRLRDRRPILAAAVLLAGYGAMILWLLIELIGVEPVPLASGWWALLWLNLGLVGWRALLRLLFVRAAYGWWQALLSIPRLVVGNVIDVAAAGRALLRYRAIRRGGAVIWEKTDHRFPDAVALAAER